MMRVLVAGDTHGNTKFIANYLYPTAKAVGATRILQLGDFGYWEHRQEGIDFLDEVADLAHLYGIDWYWLRGNHDNIDELRLRYNAAINAVKGGFWQLRPGLFWIPDGLHFTWDTARFAAFGGAYSIDKEYRLKREARLTKQAWAKEQARRDAGRPAQRVEDFTGSLWFPGEELTDAEVTALLEADPSPVDIVLSHDKPRAATLGPHRKEFEECLPNQNRLQMVLVALKPTLWLHGHLHVFYQCSVPVAPHDEAGTPGTPGAERWCSVIGLACDDQAAPRFWKPEHAWLCLDLGEEDDAGTRVPVQVLTPHCRDIRALTEADSLETW